MTAGPIVPYSGVSNRLLELANGGSGSRLSEYTPDFWAEHAIRSVYESTGDVVDVKPKSLFKFGENLVVGTDEAVIRLRVQSAGGTWRTIFKRAVNSLGPDLDMKIEPYLIAPQNSRIMMTAEADGANTPVAAGWNSILATIRKDV